MLSVSSPKPLKVSREFSAEAFKLSLIEGLLLFPSLTHDLVLPIWKSNVSLTLMMDKKAKRHVELICQGVIMLNILVAVP